MPHAPERRGLQPASAPGRVVCLFVSAATEVRDRGPRSERRGTEGDRCEGRRLGREVADDDDAACGEREEKEAVPSPAGPARQQRARDVRALGRSPARERSNADLFTRLTRRSPGFESQGLYRKGSEKAWWPGPVRWRPRDRLELEGGRGRRGGGSGARKWRVSRTERMCPVRQGSRIARQLGKVPAGAQQRRARRWYEDGAVVVGGGPRQAVVSIARSAEGCRRRREPEPAHPSTPTHLAKAGAYNNLQTSQSAPPPPPSSAAYHLRKQ